MREIDLCTASRFAGWLITGRWVQLCSLVEAHDMRRIRHAIDALFLLLRGEQEHCLMAHAYDRDRLPEPPETWRK